MTTPCLLALDPSMSAFGYAAIALASRPELLAAGVLETRPAPPKQRTSITDDDARRVRFIRRGLRAVFATWSPAIVVVEGAAGSRNAKTSKMLGEAQALAACIVDECLAEGRAVYLSPAAIETALGLAPTQRRTKGSPAKTARDSKRDRDARKERLAVRVVEAFSVEAWAAALEVPAELVLEARWEGAHDAAAVGLAAWDHSVVAAVRAIAA